VSFTAFPDDESDMLSEQYYLSALFDQIGSAIGNEKAAGSCKPAASAALKRERYVSVGVLQVREPGQQTNDGNDQTCTAKNDVDRIERFVAA
jgi:hypothetical protein